MRVLSVFRNAIDSLAYAEPFCQRCFGVLGSVAILVACGPASTAERPQSEPSAATSEGQATDPQATKVVVPPNVATPSEPDPIASAPTGPTVASAGGPCSVGTRVEVGQSEDRRMRGIGLAAARGRALIAWAEDANRVAVQSLDESGVARADRTTHEMPAARDITDIRAMGEYFLLLTHGLCVETRYHHKCLYVRVFDRSGEPIGEVTEHRTHEWMRTPLWAQSGRRLFLAYTQLYRPSVFTRFDCSSRGTVDVEPLAELAGPDGEQQPSPHAVAVDEARWALLAEKYDAEQDREVVQLVLWNGRRSSIPGLSAGSTWHAMAFEADNLHLLYSPPRGRPRHVILAFDGQPNGRPTVVVPGGTPRMPHGDRLQFALRADRNRVELERRTLAGDPVGDPVQLRGTASGASSAAYTGQRFLAAWPTRNGNAFSIGVTPVECQHRSVQTSADPRTTRPRGI